MSYPWLDANDLANWALRRDCQENLSLLIRKLIRATTNDICSISFPAGDNIVHPGWDGRLESLEETEYIPKGLSLWELSTNSDIKRKAEDDYEKRIQNPLGYNPSETVFIFVTPRIWSRKDTWVNEKKKEKFWKNVIVYDARDLEAWLEQAPAVGAWLAKHIGKYPQDVLALEDWWKEWSQVTKPPMIPELILSGRKKQIEQVKNWLKSDPRLLTVQAPTKDEAIAFLAAIILTSPDDKEYFLSKTLIALTPSSLRQVITNSDRKRLILISNFDERPGITGHHIYIPLDPSDTITKEKIVLANLTREEFITNLIKMGIPKSDAEKYFQNTSGILSVLRRQLSPISHAPEWAKPEKAREILPALLVREWNENRDGDREIISLIAEKDYSDFTASLTKWLYQPDPPIMKLENTWRLVSHIDAFFAIAPFITKSDFDNLEKISLKVLREVDPALDLEPEKRYAAAIYGKERYYSKELRKGIATTLILIAVYGDSVNGGKGLDLPCSKSQPWVDKLVRDLLINPDWKLWHSLSDVLPLLAEASPDSFLTAVEKSLSEENPPIMGMFSETENVLTTHSAHPALLWALECLAWDPFFLGRVALVLSKLARLDPGGRLINRPTNSLRQIFLLWLPQTSANLQQRLDALNSLIDKEPAVGWKALISLLPYPGDVCTHNYNPIWREFSDKKENRVSPPEYWESIAGVVHILLKHVGNDCSKWCEIMEYYPHLPTHERAKILLKLSEVIDSFEVDSTDLRNKLRSILHNHRYYSEAKENLPEPELEQIENFYKKLEPENLIARFKWLFDDYYPPFPEGGNKMELQELEKNISQKRKEAIELIMRDSGIDGLTFLADQSQHPEFIGATLAEFTLNDDEERKLLSLLESADKKIVALAQNYVYRVAIKKGNEWIQQLVKTASIEKWEKKKLLNMFIALPSSLIVWRLLDKFEPEIQSEYWREIRCTFHFDSPEEKIYALNKLVEAKRYFTAIELVSIKNRDVSPIFIAELLERAARDESADRPHGIQNWNITNLFQILDQSDIIGKETMQKLELLYLDILAANGSQRPPKFLSQELSTNPQFFAELIKYAYRPQNREEEEENLSKELKERRAAHAWKLLFSWTTVPGSSEIGKIDYESLRNWVHKARNICHQMDRIAVCDTHIGQVLSHAAPDANGNWPPDEVCRIIDEIASEHLDNGFLIGIRNQRGVTIKPLSEGGQKERSLAQKYKNSAEKIVAKYPRTSNILRKLAEGYEIEAESEDNSAKKRELEY